MKTLATALAAGLLALAATAPASALSIEEQISLYDAPRQIDRFHIVGGPAERTVVTTGSIGSAPKASMEFYDAREYTRTNSVRN